MLRSAIVISCVLAGSPLWADPQLGVDRAVDAPVLAPALLDQQTPAVGFGGGKYLVVWRDGDKRVGMVWSLRAVRLATDGTILDDPPLTISAMGELLTNPSVGFDGTQFLVAWEKPATTGADVAAVYVHPTTGVVSAPFSVAALSGSQTQPSVSGGDGFALVGFLHYSLTTPQPEIHAALFGNQMSLQPNLKISANDSSTAAIAPAVQYGGSGSNDFLVVWSEDAPTMTALAAHVSTAGVAGAPVQINGDTADVFDPAVTSDGSQYLVAWADSRTSPPSIYARVVPFSGALAATDFLVATAPGTGAGYFRPQLTSMGSVVFAAWESSDFNGDALLFGGRFKADKSRLDGEGVRLSAAPAARRGFLPSSATSARSAAASDGTNGLVVWSRAAGGATADDVFGQALDPTPVALPSPPAAPLLISRERNYERARSVASNGNVFLAVWEDDRSGDRTGLDVYGLRFDLGGVPLDAAPFLISAAAGQPGVGAPDDQFLPVAAALPGGDFLVVWADGRNLPAGNGLDLYGARVPETGAPTLLAAAINDGPGAQHAPAIAASPAGWLVTWEDWRSAVVDPGTSAVWSAFVPKTGGGTVPPAHALTTVAPQKPTACAPAAAWNGSHFLVAYEQPCSQFAASAQSDLFGQWHEPDGTLVPGPAAVLANRAGPETAPALASDGTSVFVAWRDQTTKESILLGALADGASAFTAPGVVLYTDNGVREAPAVTSSGGTLLVSYIENNPPRISGLRVRAAGLQPIDPQPFAISATASFRVPAALSGIPLASGANVSGSPRATPPAAVAAAPTGETLVVFDSIETLQGRAVTRVHTRKLGVLPSGTSCAHAAGCADAICTGGACCNTACDGVCQACGVNGCVEKPASDVRCATGPDGGALSCGALSTACRIFTDVGGGANQCAAFGQCAEPLSLAACITYVDQPDGTPCPASDCDGMGACNQGSCACAAQTPPTLAPRAAPQGCGCTVGGSARSPSALAAFWLVVALFLGCRRRSV